MVICLYYLYSRCFVFVVSFLLQTLNFFVHFLLRLYFYLNDVSISIYLTTPGCIGLPIHCNYHLAHYSGFCRISRSILNRFNLNLKISHFDPMRPRGSISTSAIHFTISKMFSAVRADATEVPMPKTKSSSTNGLAATGR